MSTKITLDKDVALKAWKLLATKEWAFEYMAALAHVNHEITRAIHEVEGEDKSSDQD